MLKYSNSKKKSNMPTKRGGGGRRHEPGIAVRTHLPGGGGIDYGLVYGRRGDGQHFSLEIGGSEE